MILPAPNITRNNHSREVDMDQKRNESSAYATHYNKRNKNKEKELPS